MWKERTRQPALEKLKVTEDRVALERVVTNSE